MKLSSYLDEELMFWKTSFEDKFEFYKFISNKISKFHNIEQEKVENALLNRDELGTMILPGSVAIPHGRIDGFDDLVIAIVKNDKPIEFGDLSASFLFVILTSKSGSNFYLKTLSTFAKLTQDYSANFETFQSSNDFLSFIEEHDVKLSEPVLVKNILKYEPITVSPNDKISKVADIMKKNNIIFLPVVDDNGKYLGKIDIIDILGLAYPEYVTMMNDISFLSSFRAYEEYEKTEKTTTVEELYVKDEKKIVQDDATIIEMGYLFRKNKWHHITVVNSDKKVVGVVSTRTILNDIVRV